MASPRDKKERLRNSTSLPMIFRSVSVLSCFVVEQRTLRYHMPLSRFAGVNCNEQFKQLQTALGAL